MTPGADERSITNDQRKCYIKSIVAREVDSYDPSVIEKAIDAVKFPASIEDVDARMTTYCGMVLEALGGVGYHTLRDQNTAYKIQIILRRLQPTALKSHMQKQIKIDESLKKNLRELSRVLKVEAKACQNFLRQTKPTNNTSYRHRGGASSRKNEDGSYQKEGKEETGGGRRPESRRSPLTPLQEASNTAFHKRVPEGPGSRTRESIGKRYDRGPVKSSACFRQ